MPRLAYQAAIVQSLPAGSLWAMEGSIFAVVLGLLAIMAQPSEAEKEPSAGASIVPDGQARQLPADQNEGGGEPATRATANLVSLFSTDDYPPEAWRNGEQGTVAVRLAVGADGKVADCVVTQSSGSAALDVQTCRILWSRGRFIPARDAKGNPVPDTYVQRIHWELPAADPTEVAEQFLRHIITVNSGRAIIGCRYEARADWQTEGALCSKASEIFGKIVSTAPDWVEFAGNELILEIQHRVGEPQGGLDLGERPGESRLALSKLHLTIDAAGKVKSCSRDSWGAARMSSFGFPCEAVAARWAFEELPAQETNRNDRQFTIVDAIYLRKSATPSRPNF